MGLLALMPIIGRWRIGHWWNVGFTMFLAAGMVLLTAMALLEDQGGPSVNAPALARIGPGAGIAVLSVLFLAAALLVPLYAREQSFRFNVIVLGTLLVVLVIALFVALAGGGTAQTGPLVKVGATDVPVQRLLLFAVLAALVLVFVVALFRDYPHADARETDPSAQTLTLRRWEWHHRTRLGLLMAVIVTTVLLVATSIVGTSGKPDYQRSVTAAHADAKRAVELASSPLGVPPTGAIWLLRTDAKTQGAKLFAKNCASCHAFDGHDGRGGALPEPPSAPDLGKFASREWIRDLMDPAHVDSERFFGPRTAAHKGKMVEFVKEDVAAYKPDEKAQLEKVIKALSAEAKLPAQARVDASDAAEIVEGRKLIGEDGLACTDCHTFHDEKGTGGPDLTGYGSREWLTGMINNPAHKRFYGKDNDRMPAFGEQQLLTPLQIAVLADFLRGEWYTPSAAPPARPQSPAPASQPAQTQPTPRDLH
jgi:mono/diheme cytochrome c family protein